MGPEVLLKRVSKETLLGDIQYRGAISDFTIVKKQISKADYDELLIRYNEDDVYGDGNNFELAVTKAAAEVFEAREAERVVAAAAAAEAAAAEAEAAKPGRRKRAKPVSKPWVSQGSETEIAEENVVTSADAQKTTLQVFRKRSSFGQPCEARLTDVDAITLWNSASMECRPFKEKTPSVRFAEADVATQAVPATRSSATQATPLAPKPMSTQYEPRRRVASDSVGVGSDASSEDPDRLRAFLAKVDPLMRSALQQNECYDIFTDDFASLADDDLGASASAETAMVEVHSFTSLRYNKGKTVACVDWVPGAFGVVAASCVATASFEAAVKDGGAETPGAVLIWDFEDPIHPRYVLEAPADVHCFQFNRSNPRLVAGGLANGRACLWDTSEMMTKNTHERDGKNVLSCVPKFVSEAPDSHVCAVTDVRWLGADVAVTKPRGELVRPNPPTGACGFFATTAADGKVLFWDVDVKKDAKKRDFFLTPSYKIKLGRGEQSGTLQAVKFDFSPALRPPARDGSLPENATRFFATSADGEVAQCDFVVPADEEGAPEHTKLCTAAHSQAVRFISRSPFFPDLVMTVGASSFKLWREGCPTPVFSSPQLATRFASCAFSPTRPSVVYVAKEDGVVDAWDLLDRSHEPSQSARVNSTAVGPMQFWSPSDLKKEKSAEGEKPREQLLAVGDAGGVLHVVRTPRALRKPRPRELERAEAFLQREMARAADAAERAEAREAAAAAREEAAAAAAAAAGGAEEKPRARAKGEREMTEDERREAEYLALEEAFMIEMGLREAPQKEE
jgi:WD40 repeat protein